MMKKVILALFISAFLISCDKNDDDKTLPQMEYGTFYSINKETGELISVDLDGNYTSIGFLEEGGKHQADLTFHNEKLYWIRGNVLYEIDPFNAASDSIDYLEISSGAFHSMTSFDGHLYLQRDGVAIEGGALYKYDFSNNELTKISIENSGDVSLRGITEFNNELYTYSEATDAMYKYDIQEGKIVTPGTNDGVNFVYGMDSFEDHIYLSDLNSNQQSADNTLFIRANLNSGVNDFLFSIEGIWSGIAFVK